MGCGQSHSRINSVNQAKSKHSKSSKLIDEQKLKRLKEKKSALKNPESTGGILNPMVSPASGKVKINLFQKKNKKGRSNRKKVNSGINKTVSKNKNSLKKSKKNGSVLSLSRRSKESAISSYQSSKRKSIGSNFRVNYKPSGSKGQGNKRIFIKNKKRKSSSKYRKNMDSSSSLIDQKGSPTNSQSKNSGLKIPIEENQGQNNFASSFFLQELEKRKQELDLLINLGKQNPAQFEALMRNKQAMFCQTNNFQPENHRMQRKRSSKNMHIQYLPSNTEFDQNSLLFSKISNKSVKTTQLQTKNSSNAYKRGSRFRVNSSKIRMNPFNSQQVSKVSSSHHKNQYMGSLLEQRLVQSPEKKDILVKGIKLFKEGEDDLEEEFQSQESLQNIDRLGIKDKKSSFTKIHNSQLENKTFSQENNIEGFNSEMLSLNELESSEQKDRKINLQLSKSSIHSGSSNQEQEKKSHKNLQKLPRKQTSKSDSSKLTPSRKCSLNSRTSNQTNPNKNSKQGKMDSMQEFSDMIKIATSKQNSQSFNQMVSAREKMKDSLWIQKTGLIQQNIPQRLFTPQYIGVIESKNDGDSAGLSQGSQFKKSKLTKKYLRVYSNTPEMKGRKLLNKSQNSFRRSSKFMKNLREESNSRKSSMNMNQMNRSMNHTIMDPVFINRMRKHNIKKIQINSNMSRIASGLFSLEDSIHGKILDENLSGDKILKDIGEEDDHGITTPSQKPLKIEPNIASQKSDESNIKGAEESSSFYTDESGNINDVQSKKEFLTSRIFTDERMLEMRTTDVPNAQMANQVGFSPSHRNQPSQFNLSNQSERNFVRSTRKSSMNIESRNGGQTKSQSRKNSQNNHLNMNKVQNMENIGKNKPLVINKRIDQMLMGEGSQRSSHNNQSLIQTPSRNRIIISRGGESSNLSTLKLSSWKRVRKIFNSGKLYKQNSQYFPRSIANSSIASQGQQNMSPGKLSKLSKPNEKKSPRKGSYPLFNLVQKERKSNLLNFGSVKILKSMAQLLKDKQAESQQKNDQTNVKIQVQVKNKGNMDEKNSRKSPSNLNLSTQRHSSNPHVEYKVPSSSTPIFKNMSGTQMKFTNTMIEQMNEMRRNDQHPSSGNKNLRQTNNSPEKNKNRTSLVAKKRNGSDSKSISKVSVMKKIKYQGPTFGSLTEGSIELRRTNSDSETSSPNKSQGKRKKVAHIYTFYPKDQDEIHKRFTPSSLEQKEQLSNTQCQQNNNKTAYLQSFLNDVILKGINQKTKKIIREQNSENLSIAQEMGVIEILRCALKVSIIPNSILPHTNLSNFIKREERAFDINQSLERRTTIMIFIKPAFTENNQFRYKEHQYFDFSTVSNH